jgi:hypothetical protein
MSWDKKWQWKVVPLPSSKCACVRREVPRCVLRGDPTLHRKTLRGDLILNQTELRQRGPGGDAEPGPCVQIRTQLNSF